MTRLEKKFEVYSAIIDKLYLRELTISELVRLLNRSEDNLMKHIWELVDLGCVKVNGRKPMYFSEGVRKLDIEITSF